MAPVYTDVNRRISIERSPVLLEDEAAVLSAIENILNTHKGERLFKPEFGSKLLDFLHDPVDADTASKIRFSLIQAIEKWEPRVTVNQMQTSVQADQELPGYRVILAVRIKGLQLSNSYNIFMRAYYGDN